MAVKLPCFAGLLKRELMPDFRVGTELSDCAKFWGRVGGIFHSDEMPNYGITAEEVEAVSKAVCAGEGDAFVFVADTAENIVDALKAVVERAQELVTGVPARHAPRKMTAQHVTCVPAQAPQECTLKPTSRRSQ